MKIADDNIYVCKISKCYIQAISNTEVKDKTANSIDPDEVAHYEPPHLDLCYWQIQLLLFLVLSHGKQVQ